MGKIATEGALRSHPGKSATAATFIGDRVVSWCDLDSGAGVAAAEIVGRVGSGFPTNAFAVSCSAADLGLANRRSLPEGFANEVAGGLLAVAVAAFDDESYVIWTES